MTGVSNCLIEFTNTCQRPAQKEKVVCVSWTKFDGSSRCQQRAFRISIPRLKNTECLISGGQRRVQFDRFFDFPDRIFEIG